MADAPDGAAEFHKSLGAFSPKLGRDKHCPEFG